MDYPKNDPDRNTPIIEGKQVTFLFEGDRPPRLLGDKWGWDPEGEGVELTSIGKDLWGLTDTLPENAYVEYHFLLEGEHCLDPRNLRKCSNGLGGYNNYFYMPKAAPSPWTMYDGRIRRGSVTRHRLEAENLIVPSRRDVWLYDPQVSHPVKLLVVLDGRDYYRRGRITTTVDNLIAAGKIEPLGLAMVDCSPSARFLEYACSDLTVAFLQQHVLELARSRLSLIDENKHPGAHGVMGSSMGGLMSVFAAARLPNTFGKALSQSGAFEIWERRPLVWDLIENNKPPIQIWLDNGRLDFLYRENLRFKRFLTDLDIPYGYQEYSGGHNQTSWRNCLWRGLCRLFPPTG